MAEGFGAPGAVKLPRGAWRTLYNVADALRPPPGEEGADDWTPVVETAVAHVADVRALRCTLAWLELETRLLSAPLRGFCWLPRQARRRRLARWERSRLAWRRQGFARLAAAVGLVLAPHSRPGS